MILIKNGGIFLVLFFSMFLILLKLGIFTLSSKTISLKNGKVVRILTDKKYYYNQAKMVILKETNHQDGIYDFSNSSITPIIEAAFIDPNCIQVYHTSNKDGAHLRLNMTDNILPIKQCFKQ